MDTYVIYMVNTRMRINRECKTTICTYIKKYIYVANRVRVSNYNTSAEWCVRVIIMYQYIWHVRLVRKVRYLIFRCMHITMMFAIRIVEVAVWCRDAVMNGGGGLVYRDERERYRLEERERERILMKLICVVFREDETELHEREAAAAGNEEDETLYYGFALYIGCIYHQNAHRRRINREKSLCSFTPLEATVSNFRNSGKLLLVHTPPPASRVFRAFVYTRLNTYTILCCTIHTIT